MKTKTKFRTFTLVLAIATSLAALGMAAACDEQPPADGGAETKTYVMEAEYIDLTGVHGAGISSEQSGLDMIYGSGNDADKAKGWSNGCFVGYTNTAQCQLEFKFESDIAATATIVLRLGSEIGNITLDSTNFSVKLNDASVAFQSVYIENSDLDTMKFYDKTITTTAALKQGTNTFVIGILENTLLGSRTGGPCIDCVKITTNAKLTWTDKTDNLSGRDSGSIF